MKNTILNKIMTLALVVTGVFGTATMAQSVEAADMEETTIEVVEEVEMPTAEELVIPRVGPGCYEEATEEVEMPTAEELVIPRVGPGCYEEEKPAVSQKSKKSVINVASAIIAFVGFEVIARMKRKK